MSGKKSLLRFTQKPTGLAIIGIVVTAVLAAGVILTLGLTGGAEQVEDNAALIGALVALGGVFTTQMVNTALEDQRTREARSIEAQRTEETRNIEAQRTEETRNIEAQRAQEDALQKYFEHMGQLIERGLRESDKSDEKRALARAQTQVVLRGLNPHRKWLVFQFLRDAKLIAHEDTIVDPADADMSGAVMCEYVDLRSAVKEDMSHYLGGADPRKYLSRDDISGGILGADGIPEPLLTIFLEDTVLRTDMSDTDLHQVNFIRANLRRADLGNVNLNGAHLIEADLIGADLPNAQLSEAFLDDAVLIGARLNRADLTGASLYGTVLIKADLSGADLSEADLSEADLSGADLSGAIVSERQLEATKSLEGATMPNDTQ